MKSQAFAAAVLLTLPLLATQDTWAQGARMRFAEMDRNGDGRITRDEWRGSARSFAVHDWNNDGVLSGDEVRAGGRRAARQAEPEDFPEGRLEMRDWTPRNFTNLDHNRDGRITRDEWHYEMEAFRRADRNRDNVLSRSEFLGEAEPDDERDDRFVDLDLNGNGRIERSEWHGSREGFDWLDRNNDNTLTYDEVIGEEETTRDSFASIDIDRSGAIERDEWHWSSESFNRRDTNRDGRLSRSELGVAEPSPVGTAGRTVVVDSRVRWTDTGITVRTGDMMTLNVQGTIRMSNDPNDVADPWGARSGRRAESSPVNTMPAGGLIAMISGSTPTFVGNRTDTPIRIPASGRLYLGVNDDHLADNVGEFRVSITIQR